MVMCAEENGYYCWFCSLGVQNTKCLFYSHFDQATSFISSYLNVLVKEGPVGTAGMYVSVGAMWYQEGGWVERRRRGRI